MRPMTMGEVRFDAGKSALFAARRSQLSVRSSAMHTKRDLWLPELPECAIVAS
jgi:hypothetical protein